jgi:hypothetical protein
VLAAMAIAVANEVTVRSLSAYEWPALAIPPSDDAMIAAFSGYRTIWE